MVQPTKFRVSTRLGLLVPLLLVTAVMAWPGDAAKEPVPVLAPAVGEVPAQAVAAGPDAEVPAAATPGGVGTARPGTVTFPDGSTRPAVNGVVADLHMPWPGGGPFAPVVAVVSHQGTDWWRHADGSMSTTIERRDQVSGRLFTLPLCYRPEPVLAAAVAKAPAQPAARRQ
jgi:hypothetical protein